MTLVASGLNLYTYFNRKLQYADFHSTHTSVSFYHLHQIINFFCYIPISTVKPKIIALNFMF